MNRVLVTRRIPEAGIQLLKESVELDICDSDEPITKEELISRIGNKDGVLSMLTDPVDSDVINAAPHLTIISNYAVGFNNIDMKAASHRKIMVTNTPGVLTDATADLTWALILALVRRIPEGERFMRNRRFTGWAPMLLLGTELAGKTLGIVGLGRIGREVARRSMGFKMKRLYHDTEPCSEQIASELEVTFCSLEHLFRESDIISLHAPLTEENVHLVNENLLSCMKPSAYLINTARGELVDEHALIRYLREGNIAGAALDVFEGEPSYNRELLDVENLVLVPHLGSATVETRDRMAIMAARNLLDGLAGRKPEWLVNQEIFR